MSTFKFKQFSVSDNHCGMKICTDSVLLGAWTPKAMLEANLPDPRAIIDLGAGCGLLSLMCAQHWPEAKVSAIEIDSEACAEARLNFDNTKWASSLSVVNANAMRHAPAQAADLIICNPPYFTSTLISPTRNRAIARHGKIGEEAGDAALTPESTISLAAKWLSPAGSLAMVTPADSKSQLLFQAELSHLALRRLCLVKQTDGKEHSRVLWLFSKTAGQAKQESLTLREKDGNYSSDYKNLTANFYL